MTLNVLFANLTPVSARAANLKVSQPAIYWVMSVLIYALITLLFRTVLAKPVTPVARHARDPPLPVLLVHLYIYTIVIVFQIALMAFSL